MSGIDGEELHSEVCVDPAHSVDIIDEDDDWVIVKKQRITIWIPPPSPSAASPQDGTLTICSKQTSLMRKSRGNCSAARKKHPKQLTTMKSQDSLPKRIEVGNSEKGRDSPSENTIHQDVPNMKGEISSPSPATAVVKSEWTKHADHTVQGLFHQDAENITNSFGNVYKPRLPIISSPLTNKIMRARLLERRVAGFGGLRNWLLTCGLGWFVEILDCEKLGMYQIVSLTMNQLKEMGLVAVGPRRKLIHAIDSLCQPYQPHQFEIVS